jgi:hypothetical protein
MFCFSSNRPFASALLLAYKPKNLRRPSFTRASTASERMSYLVTVAIAATIIPLPG